MAKKEKPPYLNSETGEYVIQGGKVLNEKQYKAYVKKNKIQFEYVAEIEDSIDPNKDYPNLFMSNPKD